MLSVDRFQVCDSLEELLFPHFLIIEDQHHEVHPVIKCKYVRLIQEKYFILGIKLRLLYIMAIMSLRAEAIFIGSSEYFLCFLNILPHMILPT